jgi:hypothetical protein
MDYGVVMITRAEWGARPPRSVTTFTPSYGTTSHWEGPHMGTFPHASCAAKVRGIQAFHMDSRGWQDIAYTYLTCPHGFVFEGRGRDVRTAANGTTQGNSTAYAVCYLGGEDDPFTDAARAAQRAALDRLDRIGGAGPGRNCHRDWKPTACPGDVICGWVRAGQPIPDTPSPTPHPDTEELFTVGQYEDIMGAIGALGARFGAAIVTCNESGAWYAVEGVWARHIPPGTDVNVDVVTATGHNNLWPGESGPSPVSRAWLQSHVVIGGPDDNVADWLKLSATAVIDLEAVKVAVREAVAEAEVSELRGSFTGRVTFEVDEPMDVEAVKVAVREAVAEAEVSELRGSFTGRDV